MLVVFSVRCGEQMAALEGLSNDRRHVSFEWTRGGIPPKVMALSMGRILVIRGGAIGDFILTLPVLQAINAHLPGNDLEVLGYRSPRSRLCRWRRRTAEGSSRCRDTFPLVERLH
jgi:hypothetical protein